MTTNLEINNVRNIYSKIANDFSAKRLYQWEWITDFVNEISKTKSNKGIIPTVLDIGCGNGRNMEGFNNADVYGIDNCQEFVNICCSNGQNVIKADMETIPFPDNYFNYIISIASFHHLSTEERRVAVLKEMCRISKPGGKMLLSVWSYVQPMNSKQRKKITHYGDIFIKWCKRGKEYERYYYIFRLDELISLFKETGWVIKDYQWNYGNEIFILQTQ